MTISGLGWGEWRGRKKESKEAEGVQKGVHEEEVRRGRIGGGSGSK